MAARRLTPAQRAALVQEGRAGEQYKVLAVRYGIAVQTVSHHMRRANMRKGIASPWVQRVWRDRCRAAYLAGNRTLRAVADWAGLPRATVRVWAAQDRWTTVRRAR